MVENSSKEPKKKFVISLNLLTHTGIGWVAEDTSKEANNLLIFVLILLIYKKTHTGIGGVAEWLKSTLISSKWL